MGSAETVGLRLLASSTAVVAVRFSCLYAFVGFSSSGAIGECSSKRGSPESRHHFERFWAQYPWDERWVALRTQWLTYGPAGIGNLPCAGNTMTLCHRHLWVCYNNVNSLCVGRQGKRGLERACEGWFCPSQHCAVQCKRFLLVVMSSGDMADVAAPPRASTAWLCMGLRSTGRRGAPKEVWGA